MFASPMSLSTPPHFGGYSAVPESIAHRGAQIERVLPPQRGKLPRYQVHVENTVDAFVRAAQLGASAVELDVISAKDTKGNPGELFVYHDDKTGRVFRLPGGDKFIQDATNGQIRQARFDLASLDATIKPKLAGLPYEAIDYVHGVDTHIPTLKEVVDGVRAVKPDMKFYIEVKTRENALPSSTNHVEEKLATFIHNNHLQDQATVISFNPWSLMKIKGLNPNLKTALDLVSQDYLKHTRLPDLMQWAKDVLKVDALLPPYQEVSRKFVDSAKAVGLKVMPWVWNETRLAEKRKFPVMARQGVDAIITNNLDLLQEYQGAAKSAS